MKVLERVRNRLIAGDAIQQMGSLPDESIDVVLTSPPYNLLNSTGSGLKSNSKTNKWNSAAVKEGYATHNDNMPHDEYVAWQRECLTQMFRLIKPTGAIFYNHKWRVQAGLLQDRSDIVDGFPVRQIIIWKRSGGINFNPGYFLPTYEVVYLIAKPDFRLAKGANSYGDVWEFKQESGNPHPAPFPVPFAKRIIAATTGKLVLDPFVGSGTTAVAAKQLRRDYIGIDVSQEYIDMANDRLDRTTVRTINITKKPRR